MKTKPLLVGLAGVLGSIGTVSAVDNYESAMKEFRELRQGVGWIQDNVSVLNSSEVEDIPGTIRFTNELQTEADARLKRMSGFLAAGEADGSIGPETAKLMHQYFDDIAAKLKRAKEQMPAPPPEPPAKPPEAKVAPKKSSGTDVPAATAEPLPDRSLETAMSQLEEGEARGGFTPVAAAELKKLLEEIIAKRASSPAEAAKIAERALAFLDEAEARGGATPEAAKGIRRTLNDQIAKFKAAAAAARAIVVQELESHLKVISAAAEKAKVYGYGDASQHLQEAFDAAGSKCKHSGDWGNAIYLACTNCVGAISAYSRPYSAEIARLKDGGDPDSSYTGYLRNQMGVFSKAAARFHVLAEEMVKHMVACARGVDEGWYFSASNDKDSLRTRPLELQGRTIKNTIRELEPFLMQPYSFADFAAQKPEAREFLSRPAKAKVKTDNGPQVADKDGKVPKKDDSAGMEMTVDAATRSVALYKFNDQLRKMEEKMRKGEQIPPGDIKKFLDNLRVLMGGRFRGPQAFMKVLSEHLDDADNVVKFFSAARSMVELSQAEGSATESIRALKSYLNAMLPVAEKVPGVGQLLKAYATAVENAEPAISIIEARARAAVVAVEDSRRWEPVTFESSLADEDAALVEWEESLPDPEEPAPAPVPAGPTLNRQNMAELHEILSTPRARVRGAESECDELFQRLIVATTRLSEETNKNGLKPVPNSPASQEVARLNAEYREAFLYRVEMRRAYRAASDLNTKILLDRQASNP